MGTVNKWIGVGYLGRDIDMRSTPSGATVGTLSIGCTETWKDRGGQKQEKTEWVRIVVWGKQAETLQDYLLKGKLVYVEGRLQTRQWKDAQDVKRYTTEIKADKIVLLGGKGERKAAEMPDEDGMEMSSAAQQSRAAAPADEDDELIPF